MGPLSISIIDVAYCLLPYSSIPSTSVLDRLTGHGSDLDDFDDDFNDDFNDQDDDLVDDEFEEVDIDEAPEDFEEVDGDFDDDKDF